MNSMAAAVRTWPWPSYSHSFDAAMASIGRSRLPPESIRWWASSGIMSTSEIALSRMMRLIAFISSLTISEERREAFATARVVRPVARLRPRLLLSVVGVSYGYKYVGTGPHLKRTLASAHPQKTYAIKETYVHNRRRIPGRRPAPAPTRGRLSGRRRRGFSGGGRALHSEKLQTVLDVGAGIGTAGLCVARRCTRSSRGFDRKAGPVWWSSRRQNIGRNDSG